MSSSCYLYLTNSKYKHYTVEGLGSTHIKVLKFAWRGWGGFWAEYVRLLPVSGHIPGPRHPAPPPVELDHVRERLSIVSQVRDPPPFYLGLPEAEFSLGLQIIGSEQGHGIPYGIYEFPWSRSENLDHVTGNVSVLRSESLILDDITATRYRFRCPGHVS